MIRTYGVTLSNIHYYSKTQRLALESNLCSSTAAIERDSRVSHVLHFLLHLRYIYIISYASGSIIVIRDCCIPESSCLGLQLKSFGGGNDTSKAK